MDQIYTKVVDMPSGLRGHIETNQDGSYTILINAKLSADTQKQVYKHELHHISNCDFEKFNCDIIEQKAHEYRTRLWSYDKRVGLQGIISAFKARRMTVTDMAEYLNVTEDFLKEALLAYKNKYGMATKVDNYVVGFEPNLYVMELFE